MKAAPPCLTVRMKNRLNSIFVIYFRLLLKTRNLGKAIIILGFAIHT